MNLRRIQYFVTIAECGNFRRASERLHIAQPALTRQMNQLEAELGVQLLERHPRGVQPTALGWTFLTDAKRILADVNDMRERIMLASHSPNGTLRAGFDDSVAQNQLLAMSWQIMHKRFPKVDLAMTSMSEIKQVEALKAREIDVGFAYDICGEFSRHAEIECHVVQTDDMVVVLRSDHFLASRKSILLADLQGQQIIMIAREKAPKIGYQYLLDSCLKGGLELKVAQEVTGIDALLNLVSVGVGISLMARHVRDVLPPALVVRPVSDLKVELALSCMWRKNSLSPTTQHFINVIKSLNSEVPSRLAQAP